jgi:hypothetical protein
MEATMRHTMFSHPRLRVELIRGTEGPRHDPYGYDEYHATTPNGTFILHEGLGTWLKGDGERITAHNDVAESDLRRTWEHLVGFTIAQINRISARLHSRCRKCGCKRSHVEHGYPGEYLYVCDDCGNIIDADFNESAVM